VGSNDMATAAKTLLVIGALFLAFSTGIYAAGQARVEPRLTSDSQANIDTNISRPTVEYRVIESRTVQYVEKPVNVVEYIERVKKIPVELRNFANLEELTQWLGAVMNTTTVYFQSPNQTIDCDDYALALQQKALADGYLVSLEITETNEYNRLFKNSQLPPRTLHAINLILIGNDAYYIEPQTGEVVFVAFLD
jgi:hypothetical protein